jgi:hypothetical protein
MNHENNQHQELQQQAEHLLSLTGQTVISILESKSNSELPPYQLMGLNVKEESVV